MLNEIRNEMSRAIGYSLFADAEPRGLAHLRESLFIPFSNLQLRVDSLLMKQKQNFEAGRQLAQRTEELRSAQAATGDCGV